jgi:hypothetical protein
MKYQGPPPLTRTEWIITGLIILLIVLAMIWTSTGDYADMVRGRM